MLASWEHSSVDTCLNLDPGTYPGRTIYYLFFFFYNANSIVPVWGVVSGGCIYCTDDLRVYWSVSIHGLRHMGTVPKGGMEMWHHMNKSPEVGRNVVKCGSFSKQ